MASSRNGRPRWPLVESLNATVPLLPRALFSRRAVADVRRIARSVRGSCDAFGFECHLRPDVDRVDLGVRLTPQQIAADRRPSWIRRFTTDPAGFCRRVSFVFLEYDADCSPRSPTASIFLGLQPAHQRFEDVKRLLSDVMAPDRIASYEPALARCFDELPRGARILVAGALRGRSPANARLSVSIPRRRIGAYLNRLGFGDCVREVSKLVRALDPHGSPAVIDFDVGMEIGPKVGVHFPTAEERLLDRLIDRGVCTAARKLAVRAWPRVATVNLWKRGWPCRLQRYLNHVKVTCTGEGPREAKAYLGVSLGLCLIR
ncbi:MAG: hypothetical protein ACREQQ_11320 [Candidatus Binatia bacterium]